MSAGLIGCLTGDPKDIASLTPEQLRAQRLAGRTVEVEGFVVVDEQAEARGHPTPYRWVRGKPSDYGGDYERRCVVILPIRFELPAGMAGLQGRQIERLEKQRRELTANYVSDTAEIGIIKGLAK